MLSRVADALYWMSRYVERAEDITRILTVNFHTLLDTKTEDAQAWKPVIAITGDEDLFAKNYDECNGRKRCPGHSYPSGCADVRIGSGQVLPSQ